MDFIHDRKSNIIFGLLGSRVNAIKFHNKTLTLKVDKIFQYTKNEEKEYPGEICFKNCDIDMCSVVIFNKTLGKGYFTGKAIYLQEFIDKYKDTKFEIITEGYFGNTTTYTGWLYKEGSQPVSAIIYIWNSGDMVYRTF